MVLLELEAVDCCGLFDIVLYKDLMEGRQSRFPAINDEQCTIDESSSSRGKINHCSGDILQ